MREATEADREIGRRIREARITRRITIRTLSNAIGVSVQQVQKYEIGANRITASRLMRFAACLDIPVTALLGLDEAASSLDAYSAKALALAEAFDRLPENATKAHLHAFVMAMLRDSSPDPSPGAGEPRRSVER